MTLLTYNFAQHSRNAPRRPATAEPARNNNCSLVTPPVFVLQLPESSQFQKIFHPACVAALSRRNHKALAADAEWTLPARSLAKPHLPKAKSNLP